MITKEKLKVYDRHGGSGDFFARMPAHGAGIINENEFAEIDNLIQDTWLIQNNLVSADYIEKANKNIAARCNNEETIACLSELAMKKRP